MTKNSCYIWNAKAVSVDLLQFSQCKFKSKLQNESTSARQINKTHILRHTYTMWNREWRKQNSAAYIFHFYEYQLINHQGCQPIILIVVAIYLNQHANSTKNSFLCLVSKRKWVSWLNDLSQKLWRNGKWHHVFDVCIGECVGVNEWVFSYGEPSLKLS